jgi:hypothetical protein
MVVTTIAITLSKPLVRTCRILQQVCMQKNKLMLEKQREMSRGKSALSFIVLCHRIRS